MGSLGFKHRKKMRRKVEDFPGEHSVGTKEKEKREEAAEEGSWGFLPLRQETEAGREKERSEVLPSQADPPFGAGLKQK